MVLEHQDRSMQIVLRISEARGFGFQDKNIYIEASLNGHCLDSILKAPGDNPTVNAELLWETPRTTVRRLRTGNVPIKVEVFMSSDSRSRSRLGFILISLRTAQVIQQNRKPPESASPEVKPACTWYKLLGVASEFKPHNPELFMSLWIQDVSNENPDKKVVLPSIKPSDISQPEGKSILQQSIPSERKSSLTPELIQSERIIQIGPKDKGTDIFLFTIVIGAAMNLDLLLNDTTQRSREEFYFCCKVMGYNIQVSSVSDIKKYSSVPNEKVVVRVRSSLAMLRTYFLEIGVMTLKFMLLDKELGFVDISLGGLVPTDDLQIFCSQYAVNNVLSIKERCYLVCSTTGEVPVTPDGTKPFVEVTINLKYIEGSSHTAPKPEETETTVENFQPQQLDYIKDNEKICSPDSLTSLVKEVVADSQNTSDYVKTKPLTDQSGFKVLAEKCPEAFHTYNLQIDLNSILLHKYPINRNIFFIFHHPQAEVIPVSHPEIAVKELDINTHLQGIKCDMKLNLSPLELQDHLLKQPPIIYVCNTVGTETVRFAQAVLDPSLLLIQQQDIKSCRYTAAVVEALSSERIGVLTVTLSLWDQGLNLLNGKNVIQNNSDNGVKLAALDDRIAYKIVEELEDWKEHQQALFRANLQKKEKSHIDTLSATWEMQRREFELALNRSVEHCNALAQSLNDTTEELKIKTLQITQKEIELDKFEKSLQHEHTLKIQELKEASRRLEDDLKLKMKKLELEKSQLQMKIDLMEKENKSLKDVVKSRDEEMEKMRKTSLSKEQTAVLLQEMKSIEEKHEAAIRSKCFFKEQWAKTVREIHRIKTEHQQALQAQIRQNKEELKNLGLEKILAQGEAEFKEDQLQLNMLRKELSKQHSLGVGDGQHFFGLNSVHSIRSFPTSTHSLHADMKFHSSEHALSETDSILAHLVEQRDSLMKTGAYSVDDPIIVKLNTDIRNILMHH